MRLYPRKYHNMKWCQQAGWWNLVMQFTSPLPYAPGKADLICDYLNQNWKIKICCECFPYNSLYKTYSFIWLTLIPGGAFAHSSSLQASDRHIYCYLKKCMWSLDQMWMYVNVFSLTLWREAFPVDYSNSITGSVCLCYFIYHIHSLNIAQSRAR